jgi:hypothetical protein
MRNGSLTAYHVSSDFLAPCFTTTSFSGLANIAVGCSGSMFPHYDIEGRYPSDAYPHEEENTNIGKDTVAPPATWKFVRKILRTYVKLVFIQLVPLDIDSSKP